MHSFNCSTRLPLLIDVFSVSSEFINHLNPKTKVNTPFPTLLTELSISLAQNRGKSSLSFLHCVLWGRQQLLLGAPRALYPFHCDSLESEYSIPSLHFPNQIKQVEYYLMCSQGQINCLQHIFHRLSHQTLSVNYTILKLKFLIYLYTEICIAGWKQHLLLPKESNMTVSINSYYSLENIVFWTISPPK